MTESIRLLSCQSIYNGFNGKWTSETGKGKKLDDRYTGPYFINRHVAKGVYENRNARDKIVKKKVNINRLKMYTCSKDIKSSSDDKANGEHEEFIRKSF